TWRDAVDENLVARQLERERFGQRDRAGFRDVVRNISQVARASAPRNPVAEVDDAAAAVRAHVRHGRVRAQKRGAKVDVDHVVPGGRRELVETTPDVHGRHVDENVEPPELLRGGVHQRGARGRIGEVGLYDGGAPAVASNDRRGLLGFLTRTAVT